MEDAKPNVHQENFSAAAHMSSPEQRSLVGTVIIVVFIAFLVSGFYYFSDYKHLFSTSSSVDIDIQSGSFPAAPIALVRGGTAKGMIVEGQGTAITVGEGDVGTTTKYFLIMDPATRRTELYKQNVANPKVGLIQLTQSGTQKVSLSVDALSGEATYMSESTTSALAKAVSVAAVEQPHIFVWSPATKSETDFGPGANPVLLPGGFFVVFERGGKLVSVMTQTKKEYPILTIPANGIYAIDQTNLKIAMYDPLLSSIQQYSISGLIGASYVSTAKVPTVPNALMFDAGTLLIEKVSGTTVTFTNLMGVVQESFASSVVAEGSLSTDHLTIRHD